MIFHVADDHGVLLSGARAQRELASSARAQHELSASSARALLVRVPKHQLSASSARALLVVRVPMTEGAHNRAEELRDRVVGRLFRSHGARRSRGRRPSG